MKRILDRFDNSPLWIRLVTVLSLSFILLAGLYTVKKNTAAQVTTEIQPAKKTGSLPVKKETKEEKEKKEEKKNTEAAEKSSRSNGNNAKSRFCERCPSCCEESQRCDSKAIA